MIRPFRSKKPSLGKILSTLTTQVQDLRALASSNAEAVDANNIQIERLNQQNKNLNADISHANRVADRLDDLVS